ncbi:TetR family transcriptional regulator [Streptomyces sp. T-3]|nr:TetR family transcriptional regulator [Streptomyces sp. T-3]
MAASAKTPAQTIAELVEAQPKPGLRERKKVATRVAIRRAAYRLIDEQGWEATTIEQIAAAAEVSPSTVFRYFPAKEDIVLTDEYDPIMMAVLRDRPASEPLLESIRFVMTGTLHAMLQREDERAELVQRTRLIVEVPAIRARMVGTISDTSKLLCGWLAERSGRAAGELEVRVFAAAVLGALREATMVWGEGGFEDDVVELVERTLDMFGRGLTL